MHVHKIKRMEDQNLDQLHCHKLSKFTHHGTSSGLRCFLLQSAITDSSTTTLGKTCDIETFQRNAFRIFSPRIPLNSGGITDCHNQRDGIVSLQLLQAGNSYNRTLRENSVHNSHAPADCEETYPRRVQKDAQLGEHQQ